jgi:pilus assembly protein CpaF
VARSNGAPTGGRSSLVRAVGLRLGAGKQVTEQGVEVALKEVLEEQGVTWKKDRVRQAATKITDELAGFGPLGPLLRDPEVSEIMVNAGGEVYVERKGHLELARIELSDPGDVRHLIERVVSPLGLRADATSPWVDARLADGSRFHAVLPPVAVGGPVVTIRRFVQAHWKLGDLVGMKSIDRAHAARLSQAVRKRQNVLVSGGGGAGKTTLLGVLVRMVPPDERVVSIEDAAELRTGNRHVVSLEARPPNVEGKGEVGLRELVRCAMRMRADRIVVGEVRGAEALDMLQALTSGHSGSMATVHADAPKEALQRLEVMALMGSPGLQALAARRQVGSAFDLVVHLVRDPAGRRRVSELAEVRNGPDGPVLRRVKGSSR